MGVSPRHRDLICVGASAGGITAVSDLLAALPADLPAAVFVVIHIPRTGDSVLPQILQRYTGLRVKHPKHGEPIEHGTVYVAPTNRHLLILPDRLALGNGPVENRVRPAVDALFRSAAVAHSSRVIGVVLTGNLDDGAAGLAAIKGHGGVAVVQDPDEAVCPGMPRAAVDAVQPDAVLPIAEIAPYLTRLVGQPASDSAGEAEIPAQPRTRIEELTETTS
jgi:two-component system, chemotaxis family, protein-glutamate methylesterase/glutaminase